jgi:hypothetical protein
MVTKYVPRLSMAKFPRRRVCEIARCKNMEVNSLTRTGASAAFSHLICDDCLKDIVLLSIEKFRHDKDFKLAVSDIFGGEKVTSGQPVQKLVDKISALEAENAKMEVQIAFYEEDANLRSKRAAEAKATRAKKRGESGSDED